MFNKKRLAAEILNTSPEKVRFSEGALEDIKKAISRSDIKGLIAVGKITRKNISQHSRAGARARANQKRKGRQKGRGRRKGKKYSRLTQKDRWMSKIRVQRSFLKELKEKDYLSTVNYRELYNKSKGGFFRNKRHIKLYLTEHNLLEKK